MVPAAVVLVDRVGFHLTGLAHGDVVVVTLPGEDAYPAVKRIVGLSGDRISYVDGWVVRNGEPVTEGYLDSRHYGTVPESGVVGRVVLYMP